MNLPEPIETINKRLERDFGRDIVTGKPYFRVVFSDDQLEKRRGTYNDFTREGIFLRTVTEVREVPKYRQWIHHKYLLEGLTIVPSVNQEELPTQQLSYEPLWVFEDKESNPLPPIYEACQFVLQAVRRQVEVSNTGTAKYKEEIIPDKERVDRLQKELFGNETPVTDALMLGSGISMTGTDKNEKVN